MDNSIRTEINGTLFRRVSLCFKKLPDLKFSSSSLLNHTKNIFSDDRKRNKKKDNLENFDKYVFSVDMRELIIC